MEGIREIAKCYYDRASEEEKSSLNELFRKLDMNGDGKVSLLELKNSATSWSSAHDVFQKLDADGDRALDFNEFSYLYYMEKKINVARCSGCWDLLLGPYFSCTLCLGESPFTYDLCCSCYRREDLSHEHSSTYLLDHHSLIMLLKDRTSGGNKSRRKKEMEELREIAQAHYRACSPQVQALAHQLYKSMDKDGDGRVDLHEFLAFMRHEGYPLMHNPYFFDELDKDGNGTLDFSKSVTLYYIITSGRPCCGCCGKFIPGIFFSCVECFENPEASFDLCRDCYCFAKYKHDHNGRSQFLDNYMLLQGRASDPAPARGSGVNSNEGECSEFLNERTAAAGKSQEKKEMEQLREIAEAHYQAASPEAQASANEFYKSMVADGDGRVDLSEFLAFTRKRGYSRMRNPSFFSELDRDGDGALDFSDVATLHYVVKSGRPFCDCCGEFIPGIFFSCAECFDNPETSFNVCPRCCRSGKCNHDHDGRGPEFLDSFTLLEARRDAAPAQAAGVCSEKEVTSDDADSKPKPQQSSPPPQFKKESNFSTLEAIGTGVTIGGAAVNAGLSIASIAGCCIM